MVEKPVKRGGVPGQTDFSGVIASFYRQNIAVISRDEGRVFSTRRQNIDSLS